ncbi:hypothetical protein [Exiguobacterium aurantiacum]|uniref:hypothetical protein n=1 Tax=Exiguobacterium aurantiacum TaxID=33987 RepID=UPI00384B38A1
MTIALTGCGSNDFRTDGIEEVRVSESDGFSSFQERDVITYDELEDVKVFADMIRNTEQQPGVVNMATPEYDVEVQYQDETVDRYYVWLGDLGMPTSIMDVNDTHTVYLVPADVTDELIRLLEQG